MYDMIAQGIGLVAMVFGVLSFQGKSAKTIIIMQFCAGALFAVNYYMLGQYLGAILNVIAVLRALLFLKKDRFHAASNGWLLVFLALYIGAYALTFAVFGVEPSVKNLILQSMPVIAMIALHLGMQRDSAKSIRRFGLVSSVAWMIFNIAAVAVGAILCEAFALISNISAMIRLDGLFRKKQ